MGQPLVEHLHRYYGKEPLYVGGYAYGIEKLEHALHELEPLHAKHWEETERRYLKEDMDPDYSSYIELEQDSQLIMVTCRATDTTLAGHIVFTLAPHTNVQSKLVASEEALYMHPDHRGRAVLRLLDYAEDALWRLGVHYIVMNDKAPSGGVSLEPLLGRRGFAPFAVSYIKKLER